MHTGVASLHELQTRFESVASAAHEAALVPEKGGLGWHAIAKVMSGLQVKEHLNHDTITDNERNVLQAEAALKKGDLVCTLLAPRDKPVK